ncbi:MAG: RDD family protein [Leptospirales bacterium]
MLRHIVRIIVFLLLNYSFFLAFGAALDHYEVDYFEKNDFGVIVILFILLLFSIISYLLTKIFSTKFLHISDMPLETQRVSEFTPASVMKRFKALMIDVGVILLLLFIIGKFVVLFNIKSQSFDKIALVFLFLLYEPILVSSTYGTIGHHLMRIKVLSVSGKRVFILVSFVRYLIKWILGILSLLSMVGKRQQSIHDILTGTVVVNKS